MSIVKSNHCVFDTHYHIVFPVKYRKALLEPHITAKQLFKQFPELRKDLWGGEFWSDGYFISTISEKGNWQQVETYVRNQGKTKQTDQLRLL